MADLLAAGKGSDSYLAALKYVAVQLERQALTLSCNDILLLMGGCFLVTLPLLLLLSKPAGRA
jgi:hypothetical protein